MTAATVDEETPLLQEQQPKKKPTPIPWAQFNIILVTQFVEPLTSTVIYPFLPQVREQHSSLTAYLLTIAQLIRDVGITHGDETQVAYYVGMMVSQYRVDRLEQTEAESNPNSNQYSLRQRP